MKNKAMVLSLLAILAILGIFITSSDAKSLKWSNARTTWFGTVDDSSDDETDLADEEDIEDEEESEGGIINYLVDNFSNPFTKTFETED